jgi:hypothetical protein
MVPIVWSEMVGFKKEPMASDFSGGRFHRTSIQYREQAVTRDVRRALVPKFAKNA